MGTTLEHGVYLPDEGERNCYAGLKVNWETLDQKVADISALQSAIAGALHREIVASLPTTDIDPNTIYMILSGTSATENIYDEYMHISNAWELIGTSVTDLTNYYTKAEVDGKLLLKANASDLTSHTGDTTIHVTASDKAKWDTVALIKQLRLVNTQVGSSTTIAFANIDDTNGIKVGDKCMDLDAKMFEITAVDTTNQTVTVGSALVDLALDANVVHTSGNETVNGEKTFNDLQIIGYGTQYKGARNAYILPEFSAGYSGLVITTLSFAQTLKIGNFVLDANNKPSLDISKGYIQFATGENNGVNACVLEARNSTSSLGTTANRWSKIYGTEYYYGSNNVEFSTKFVTTDTNQTISGNKTFSSDLTVYNSDTTANTSNLNLKNHKIDRGTTETGVQTITFLDKNAKALTSIESRRISNGNTATNILCYNTDDSNNTVSGGVAIIKSKTDTNFAPNADNAVTCGRALAKWSDVQTYLVNGLTPSSLSFPSNTGYVDISGYFTNTANGDTNTYTVPANGWIYLNLNDVVVAHCFAQTAGNLSHYGQTFSRASAGQLHCLFPVRKDDVFVSQWYTTTTVTVTNAYFVPCLGNI